MAVLLHTNLLIYFRYTVYLCLFNSVELLCILVLQISFDYWYSIVGSKLLQVLSLVQSTTHYHILAYKFLAF